MQPGKIDAYSTYLYHQGNNSNSYALFGAHELACGEGQGVRFSVWAPHAQKVSVVGDFNKWQAGITPMTKAECGNGIWNVFVPGLSAGICYKYAITTADGTQILKSDPYAFATELRPATASRVANMAYAWQDSQWQEDKKKYDSYHEPMLIYEVHAGTWRRGPGGRLLTYRELAAQLIPYLLEQHYTHVEFLPLCEYPFDGSWGYQATGYFAATSRYGTPQDLMFLIDQCHQYGLGVILDWVPGHYCKDAHGLRHFDGEPLYESGNPVLAENHEWDTMNFDYGRPEVQSFLISSAMFWLTEYHLDGLRIDAVANMLYLDYGKGSGAWQPNKFGGRENLEAIDFLRKLNQALFAKHPQALVIAEESTAWPLVTKPVDIGGLGFNYKWNMGWMNDMLKYMSMDPVYRGSNHNLVTFSFYYAFSENFILPLSHDEVVHGKHSLLDKMPGDYWQKFANLRAFYGYWMAHPGKKLLFMGGEFGQFIEWKDDDSLDWHLLKYPQHATLHFYVRSLNEFYVVHPEFWQVDDNWEGFTWLCCDDYQNSVLAFMRQSRKAQGQIVVICNFTPVVRENYRIGVPVAGLYTEIFNSDAKEFGGSGVSTGTKLCTEKIPSHGQKQSLVVTLPPLATVYLCPGKENGHA